ncbi:MAG: Sir2 family NAD-dependent protein deacetylase [Myxococcaceae bacterium]
MDSKVSELARTFRDARRVVFVCGAGMSVASGVRAYRSGPGAIWSEMVLEWGTFQKFTDDPAAWWREFWLKAHGDVLKLEHEVKPNAGHAALVAFMAKSAQHLVVTQNIDGLHRRAGHPEGQLIEIHGRHDRFICASGGGCEGVDHPVDRVDLSGVDAGRFPRCPRCDAPMRPNVLLFDEAYDSHPAFQAHRARKALNDADVLAFVGTSFSVGITSYAVHCAQVSGATVVNVNVERAPFETVGGGGSEVLNVLGRAEELLPALLA